MNSLLKVAVMLTAYDQMSREIQAAVNKSKRELTDLKNHATAQFAQGFGLMGAGAAGFQAVGKTIAAYADLEDAALSLKSVMMTDGGEDAGFAAQFKQVEKLAEQLGNRLPGNTADFYNMFATMIRSGVPANNILKGTGEAAAYLAVALKMPYDEAGKMAAKLKEATGIADAEMVQFMDTIARTANVGVDTGEMQFAFARSAAALKMMNIQGLESSKSISAVYAMLVKSGQSGESIGTGMTSVFNNLTNGEKIKEFNDALAQYGIQVDFVDKKTGKFKGVENMMMQFEKIKRLNLGVEQQGALTRMLLGPGADANFVNLLINKGVAGFNEMTRSMATQATLNNKVEMQLGGLKNKWEAATGTFTNLLAALGARLAPALGKIVDFLGMAAAAVQVWVSENPRMSEFIMLVVTFVSAALMIAGVIKIIMGLVAVFKVLNIVMAMNPFILIAMVAIVAVALIIAYWDKIKAFFIRLWESVKMIFRKAWDWIKLIFMHSNPYTLIYLYWDKIAAFFVSVWAKVKNIFSGFINWVKGIGVMFYDAGVNIAKQIWEGIKAMAHKPVEAVKDMVQKCRDLLPFSPAKTGPFKDLHKIKIVETIAASIKASPMVQAMSKVVSQAVGFSPRINPITGSGGGVTLHYAPIIHIGAGANKADFLAMLEEHKDDVLRMLERWNANKSRTKF